MRALHAEAALIRTALVTIDLQEEDGPLLRPRDGLTAILLDEYASGDALFACFSKPARAAGLAPEDFAHLAHDVQLLAGLLRNAAATREAGINIFLKKPNRAVRRRIAERAFAACHAPEIDDAFLTRIANIEDASPGQITQAARVAKLRAPGASAAQTAERVLAHGLRALRQRAAIACEHATRFDAKYLNCGMDVQSLIEKLARNARGRLVFHGPPGTGKSALARHIAEAADRPLLVKRASDLLSKWVGEAEQNIALAFEEAADEGAVLLLDEADSFLSDRRDAHARWELTETNELLTQMEQFEGLFICTTNLMDRLDRAALRRFTLKLRFDYLAPRQIHMLLTETLLALGCSDNHPEALDTATRFKHVTPGDAAAVVERFRLLEVKPGAAGFVSALREELALKQEGSVQRMGF